MSDLISYFDRCTVINLQRRADRLREFQSQLEGVGWPFKPIEVSRAFDGGSGLIPCPSSFRQGGGAYGCKMSHLTVTAAALMDELNTLLVFEDDAVFAPTFAADAALFLSRVPDDWQMLYLGGQHFGTPTAAGNGVVRCHSVGRTHAYALRGREAMQQWYLWCAAADVHIDWHTDRFLNRVVAYAPERFIVGQRGGTRSDICGRENRGTYWTAPAADSLVVWLRETPREVVEKLREQGFHFGFDRDEQGRDVGLNRAFGNASGQAQNIRERTREVERYLDWVIDEANARQSPSVAAIWHPDSGRYAESVEQGCRRFHLVTLFNPSVEEAVAVWQTTAAAGEKVPALT